MKCSYGITPDDFDDLLLRQNGRCAICQGLPEGKGVAGRWHIDHDHKTGKVRGILCQQCNLLLGNARDDTMLLVAAIKYLEETA